MGLGTNNMFQGLGLLNFQYVQFEFPALICGTSLIFGKSVVRDKISLELSLSGRLMVGLRILNPPILVQVQARQPRWAGM